MKISNKSSIHLEHGIELFTAFFSISVIGLIFWSELHIALLAIPVIITIGSLFLFNNASLYLLIFSFSVSIISIKMGNVAVYLSDFFVLFILIALFKEKKNFLLEIKNSEYKNQFLILFLFLALSFAINFMNYSSKSMIYGFNILIQSIKIFLVFIIGVIYAKNSELKEKIITIFLIISTIPLITQLLQIFILKNVFINNGAHGSISNHHSAIGLYFLFPIFLLLGRIMNKKHINTVEIILFISYLSGMFLAQSRSSLFSLLIAVPFIIWKLREKIGFIKILFGIIIILFFLFATGLIQMIIMKTFGYASQTGPIDLSTYSRIFIWQASYNSFINFPLYRQLFGCGIGSFSENVTLLFSLWGDKSVSGAHNNYLQALIGTGVFGLITFLYFWLSIAKDLLYKSKFDIQIFTFTILTFTLLISGISQETFWFNPWHGYFVPIYFFLLGLITTNKRP